jgi:release factor glutamine methyltransferase
MMHPNSDASYRDIEARLILQPVITALKNAGIASANGDARCLLGLALGHDAPVLPHETVLLWDRDKFNLLQVLVQRRCSGEPVSRLRGWREFWSLRFALSPATLDPRPDSETVIDAAVGWARQRGGKGLRCLDLGTGSGCLLLACLSELPNATGIGLDIDADAVAVAASNAAALGLAERAVFCQQDFAADLTSYGQFDMILSNPPYIPTADITMLAADVRHFDPIAALDGGDDGLDCWRFLVPQLAVMLAEAGSAFVEIGAGQGPSVCDLAAANHLQLVTSYKDLAGHERCLQLQKEI